jgi:uncharacterized protein (TIGR00730 family)
MADEVTSNGKHRKMGIQLAQMLEEGKKSVPVEPAPLVCKPRELEPWRVFKIMSEFVEGFELLQKYSVAVSFFGSTRRGLEDHFYTEATELAGRLAKRGFAVITGGATGIMEAGNKGAYEVGGSSVGLNIHLDANQSNNQYLTDTATFNHFFVRKTMLTFASEAYIFFPGGFGTLDEFFEIITLIQTKKIQKIPVVIYGKEYWEPLLAFIQSKLLDEHKAINKEDMDIFHLADTVDEAYDYIVKHAKC